MRRRVFNVKYIFYDTETTGLSSTDEVIQFAAFVVENNKIVESKSFYCYTQKSIHPGAAAVSGITKEVLMQKSNGRYFEDYWNEWSTKDESDICWIAYSKNNFDAEKINATLSNNGSVSYDFGKQVPDLISAKGRCYFDLYTYRTGEVKGKRKLINEAERLGFTLEGLQNTYSKMYSRNVSLHDASFDAFVLMCVVSKLNLLKG